MRWEDERYVRAYTRDTTDWLSLSWKAQGLFLLILRKVDRAGILELGKRGKRGVASHIGGPAAWVELEPALDELITDGCISFVDDGGDSLLVVPNFVEAQEAKQSDKARKRAERERARDIARHGQMKVTQRDTVSAAGSGHAEPDGSGADPAERVPDSDTRPGSGNSPSFVTQCDNLSDTRTESREPVTTRPVESQPVTPSRAVPSLAEQKLEPDPDNPDRPPLRLQLVEAIRKHRLFDCIDAEQKAAAIEKDFWSAYSTVGTKVDWWLASIDECASKFSGTGLSVETLSSRLSSFTRQSRAPRQPAKTSPDGNQRRPKKDYAEAAAIIDARMKRG